MQHFNNILVIYDIEAGGDECLQRGVHLAQKNNAMLTVLHVIEDDFSATAELKARNKLIQRVCAGFDIDKSQLRIVVRIGNKVNDALYCIERFNIDLIIAVRKNTSIVGRLLSDDSTCEIMEHTDCPIWFIRPGSASFYRNVLVCVNAGKEEAMDCPSNKQLLKLGKELAEMEKAELKVLYVWDYDIETKARLSSEIHDDMRKTIYEGFRYDALSKLIRLMIRTLGEPLKATPVVQQGEVKEAIYDYIAENSIDVLVSEGTPKHALVDAVMGNRGLQILNNANCCVLLSRA